MRNPVESLFRLSALASGVILLATGCDFTNRNPPPARAKPADMVVVEIPQPPLIDEDYCFSIHSAGRDWKLMSESEVQRMIPEAVAGVLTADGFYGMVIVEPLPTTDLPSYVELLIENSPMPSYPFSDVEELTYLGRPAAQFGRSAVINGLELTYDHLIFIHDDFGYQLVSFAMSAKFSPRDVQQFHDAFQLIEGDVQGRSGTAVADFDGVGQRVSGGRFESPVYAMAVEPAHGWQLMIGDSLARAHPDAEVGLENAAIGAYAVIIPERVQDVDHDAYRLGRLNTVMDDLEIAEQDFETFAISLDGRQIEFNVFQPKAEPFHYYWAMHFEEDIAYQFLAWHASREGPALRPEIEKAMQCVRLLDTAAADQLAAELLAKPDPENVVGPKFSLRNGTYRDFLRGTVWNKPPGFWRLLVGDAARAQNEAASIHGNEPQHGLWFQLIDEDLPGLSADEYHRAVIDNTFGVDHSVHDNEPLEQMVGAQPALVSEGDILIDEVSLTFRVATIVRNDHAHQLLVWGIPENMAAARLHAEAVLHGFRFDEPLRETVSIGPLYRDSRVGFEIRLPQGGWKVRDNVMPEFSAAGNAVQFDQAGKTVLVMAIASFQPGQDISWASQMINDIYEVNFSQLANSESVESQSSLGGLPAIVKRWKADGTTTHTVVAVKDRTIFALMVTDAHSDGELFKSAVDGFRVLP